MNKSNLQTYDEPIELGKSLDGHRSHRAFRISDEYVAKLGIGKETVSNQKLLNILHICVICTLVLFVELHHLVLMIILT